MQTFTYRTFIRCAGHRYSHIREQLGVTCNNRTLPQAVLFSQIVLKKWRQPEKVTAAITEKYRISRPEAMAFYLSFAIKRSTSTIKRVCVPFPIITSPSNASTLNISLRPSTAISVAVA